MSTEVSILELLPDSAEPTEDDNGVLLGLLYLDETEPGTVRPTLGRIVVRIPIRVTVKVEIPANV
jgi:hypothetical protein